MLANMVDKRPIPAGNVAISCLSKLFHFVGCDAGPQRYQNWPNMGYLMQKQKRGRKKREKKKFNRLRYYVLQMIYIQLLCSTVKYITYLTSYNIYLKSG